MEKEMLNIADMLKGQLTLATLLDLLYEDFCNLYPWDKKKCYKDSFPARHMNFVLGTYLIQIRVSQSHLFLDLPHWYQQDYLLSNGVLVNRVDKRVPGDLKKMPAVLGDMGIKFHELILKRLGSPAVSLILELEAESS